jgi:hypothetical protein
MIIHKASSLEVVLPQQHDIIFTTDELLCYRFFYCGTPSPASERTYVAKFLKKSHPPFFSYQDLFYFEGYHNLTPEEVNIYIAFL